MKRTRYFIIPLLVSVCGIFQAHAWDLNRILSAGVKTAQAITLSDSQIKQYVHEYVTYQDKENKVADPSSDYSIRLTKLTQGLADVDGTPLNFKVYITDQVNAFACADGSVRVYSGLMDRMNDDEVLGVIGHEVGHVAHKDTKNAFKNALLTSALRDGLGATNDNIAALTDSQLGDLGEKLVSAKYSQKQESNADSYGYEFLKKSGKNPWALAMAFQKLGQLEGSATKSNGLVQLFSSHPSTSKRIKDIVKKCRKDKIDPPAGCTISQ